MPPDAQPEEHAPRKLRVETLSGLVFGTLGTTTPPLETYLGAEIMRDDPPRDARSRSRLLGGYSQMLPSNWKLYMENVKDTYHASLLHMFFTTFRLNRLSQKGGLVVSETAATTSATRCRPTSPARNTSRRAALGAGRLFAGGARASASRSTSSVTASACRS